jgi:AraC family transcriptional regulator
MPMLSITRRDIHEQPILFIRSRVARADIAATIGQSLGRVFAYAQRKGYAIAGAPFARYPEMGPGLMTMDVGMPVAAPAEGEGEIQEGTLPGGPVAVAVHAGPYDQLPDTFAATDRWLKDQGLTPAGGPWESYITDPGEQPDPADWRTEVYFPLAPGA